jgi:haloalkane dehalogenase
MTTVSPTAAGMSEIAVLGSSMAYREAGAAHDTIALFLHGNPTSSFIWSNIIPHVTSVARCIAPDLIGFGKSGKPPIDYRFADHVRYLDAFLDRVVSPPPYVVAQDWGTALAFELAAPALHFVKGLAFMEFIRPIPSWDDFHKDAVARATFQKFRTPGVGEKMVLEDNVFVERVLPGSIVRKLSDAEIEAYRQPFPDVESRGPVLALPRQLPIEGEPADVYATLEAAHAALRQSDFPKLLFAGNPGALVSPTLPSASPRRSSIATSYSLDRGLHYLQEDHPDAIGHAIAGWIAGVEGAAPGRSLAA